MTEKKKENAKMNRVANKENRDDQNRREKRICLNSA